MKTKIQRWHHITFGDMHETTPSKVRSGSCWNLPYIPSMFHTAGNQLLLITKIIPLWLASHIYLSFLRDTRPEDGQVHRNITQCKHHSFCETINWLQVSTTPTSQPLRHASSNLSMVGINVISTSHMQSTMHGLVTRWWHTARHIKSTIIYLVTRSVNIRRLRVCKSCTDHIPA